MVNFWATSCITCVGEMPKIIETYNKYHGQGFETIAVAMSYDPPNYVLNYTEKNKLPFKVALDIRGDLARSFGDIRLTPTTFIIDKRGNIVKQYLGEPDFAPVARAARRQAQRSFLSARTAGVAACQHSVGIIRPPTAPLRTPASRWAGSRRPRRARRSRVRAEW